MTMNSNDALKQALRVLREGGLILYPTDTVWGIGCDACNEAAVKKVFALKKRSDSKSLVLLADSADMIDRCIDEIPAMALQLIEVNDAPMTIVYPGAYDDVLAPSCIAEDGSVGIRIPTASEFCMALLKVFGKPIVSTSANISGESTPKTFDEITASVRSGVDYIVPLECQGVATGRSSQIIKVDLDGGIKVIRG